MTFEEKLEKLEEIVNKLENEKLNLESSIALYQEAKKLSDELNKELNESINKMSYIVENGQVRSIEEIENTSKDI